MTERSCLSVILLYCTGENMGILFNKYKEPVFLKESSNAEIQLEQLKELEPQLNEKERRSYDRISAAWSMALLVICFFNL